MMAHEAAILGGDDSGGDGRGGVLERNPHLDAAVLTLQGRDLAPIHVEVDDRRRSAPGHRQGPPSPGQDDRAEDRNGQQNESEDAARSLQGNLSDRAVCPRYGERSPPRLARPPSPPRPQSASRGRGLSPSAPGGQGWGPGPGAA